VRSADHYLSLQLTGGGNLDTVRDDLSNDGFVVVQELEFTLHDE
jgi:hypothetical protein